MPATINVIESRAWDNHNFRDSDSFREYLLAELRSARIKADLWRNHIDTIGCALRGNLITPEQVLSELKDSGFLDEMIVRATR